LLLGTRIGEKRDGAAFMSPADGQACARPWRLLTSHANISETVWTIFQRYLDLGSMGAVIEDLDRRGICTNV
jgi:hypothetical protein